MLKDSKAFSGFSVDDIGQAKAFYHDTLGLDVDQDQMGLTIHLGSGAHVFVYPKDDHQPASFTILNFPVENIDKSVEELAGKGVIFEHYTGGMLETDEKGIARGKSAGMGPDIAWFKDPAGNTLAILSN